jgi:hypothetical protein
VGSPQASGWCVTIPHQPRTSLISRVRMVGSDAQVTSGGKVESAEHPPTLGRLDCGRHQGRREPQPTNAHSRKDLRPCRSQTRSGPRSLAAHAQPSSKSIWCRHRHCRDHMLRTQRQLPVGPTSHVALGASRRTSAAETRPFHWPRRVVRGTGPVLAEKSLWLAALGAKPVIWRCRFSAARFSPNAPRMADLNSRALRLQRGRVVRATLTGFLNRGWATLLRRRCCS